MYKFVPMKEQQEQLLLGLQTKQKHLQKNTTFFETSKHDNRVSLEFTCLIL